MAPDPNNTVPGTTPIRWPAEAIWEAVEPDLPGFTVEVLPLVDSSNSELMRRFRGSAGVAPQLEPTLLVAEEQSAGRGRLGRQWQGRRGDSLTFSLGLTLRPSDWSGLSLVVGISLAESLDPGAGPTRVGLKWPNDLWLTGPAGERKLAGILVETAGHEGSRHVVMGVGINIRPGALTLMHADPGQPAPLPPGYAQDIHPELDAPAILLKLVPPLVRAVQAFEQFGFAPFQARFARHDLLAGRAVKLSGRGSQASDGTAHGVTESGALLVHTPAGMKEINSSEVSVRPMAAQPESKPAGQRPC